MSAAAQEAEQPQRVGAALAELEERLVGGRQGTQVRDDGVAEREALAGHLGVRLVPSADAEATVEGLGGMRHTSGRRYSRDDPEAVVIVVSEDGPVTIFRDGDVVARSR